MLRIVTLVENEPGEHHALKAEHGLSFYLEAAGHRLLFDTGQSAAFLENARRLNLDLARVEHVVLSHGHYDHSGGIRPLLAVNRGFRLVVGRGFFTPKYATDGVSHEFLGNDFGEGDLRQHGVSWKVLAGGKEEIVPGVFAVHGFPRVHADETINPRFVRRCNGRFEPDPFEDEILLVIETSRGSVVLLGCSHPGVKNMLEAVRRLFPGPLYAVLGGTHLVEASDGAIAHTLAYLQQARVEVIGVSHCTGKKASAEIRASLRGHFSNCTGKTLWID